MSVRTAYQKVESRRKLGIDIGRHLVLAVGQLQPRKALTDFYRCAAAFPDALFIWVGGYPFGPLTAQYWTTRRLVRNSPENVVHVGQVERDQVMQYYLTADVYLHPSRQENASVAVLEAATAGIPLVLRSIECHRELYGEAAILFGSILAMKLQIHRLLSCSPYRVEMAARARILAEKFSCGSMAERLVDIYRN
ncbi:glycosyltransferase family 4 protein [Pseudonocardia sp.]|uniref:glycosyltransferase family 4 protein n=1 Tax=Pseudonocardia sp. TaxID=60912 RepID=UPI00260DAA50|nr:glycosyltransferase family 4 protein [Pseudonocardia sp.]